MRALAAAALCLCAGGAQADAVSEWIEAQPQPFQPVLIAGQTESAFTKYRDQCPADVFPAVGRHSKGSQECSERPGWCLVQCRAGVGRACFGIARAIEVDLDDVNDSNFSYPFFMAACAAGSANGCTNAAATSKNGDWLPGLGPGIAAERDCQYRTYQAACEANAPWGCFMLGMEWGFEGVKGEVDRDKAVAAWQRACVLDPDGGACASSQARLDVFAD